MGSTGIELVQDTSAKSAKRLAILALTAAFFALIPFSSPEAAARTWDNTAPGGNWNACSFSGFSCSNTNWIGTNAFVNHGDSLNFISVYGNSGSGLFSYNDLAGRQISTILFGGGRNTTNIGGQHITLVGDSSNLGMVNYSNAGQNINAVLELNGLINFQVNGAGWINLNQSVYNDNSVVGTLYKSGNGTLKLNAQNFYSGGTVVTGGTLNIDADNRLGNGSLTLANGTLETNDSFTTNRLTTLNSNGFIEVQGSATLTHNGNITGGGYLYKDGTGTLALGGTNNSYTGHTVVRGGTLRNNTSNQIGNNLGGLYVQGGATFDLNDTNETVGFISDWSPSSGSGGTIDLGSGFLELDRANVSLTFSGNITGTGGRLKQSGAGSVQTLSGNNTYTGYTWVDEGTIRMGAGGNLSDQSDLYVYSGATFDLNGQFITVDGLAGQSGVNGAGGSVTLGGGQLTVGANGSSGQFAGISYFNGVISGSGGTNSANGLKKTGTGTQVLGGNNTYTGWTWVNQGTLRMGAGGNLSDQSDLYVYSGATFDLNGQSISVDSLSGQPGTNGAGGSVTLGGGQLTIGANGSTGQFAGISYFNGVISGSGGINAANGLKKNGSGTQVLGGNNTYTGWTWVNQGTLRMGAGGNLSDQSDLYVYGGATFDLNGQSITVDALQGQSGGFGPGGSVQLGGGQLTVGAFGSVSAGGDPLSTFNGDISGSGGLTKTGAGTQTLGGENTYTGDTNVNQGVLALSGNGTFDSAKVTIASGARLDLSGRTTLDNFSSNLVNNGRVDGSDSTQLTMAGDLINQGIVDGGTAGLLLEGEVTGGGDYEGDVTFLNSFRPGNSPDLIFGENITFGETNTLFMELGGLGRGSQYDAFNISGALTFGGALNVSFINGFGSSIALNDSFDLFNFDPFQASGTFASIVLPTLTSGWMWDITGLYTEGVVFVTEALVGEGVPVPGAVFILVIGLAGFGVLRRR